jgi:hypothetical protein
MITTAMLLLCLAASADPKDKDAYKPVSLLEVIKIDAKWRQTIQAEENPLARRKLEDKHREALEEYNGKPTEGKAVFSSIRDLGQGRVQVMLSLGGYDVSAIVSNPDDPLLPKLKEGTDVAFKGTLDIRSRKLNRAEYSFSITDATLTLPKLAKDPDKKDADKPITLEELKALNAKLVRAINDEENDLARQKLEEKRIQELKQYIDKPIEGTGEFKDIISAARYGASVNLIVGDDNRLSVKVADPDDPLLPKLKQGTAVDFKGTVKIESINQPYAISFSVANGTVTLAKTDPKAERKAAAAKLKPISIQEIIVWNAKAAAAISAEGNFLARDKLMKAHSEEVLKFDGRLTEGRAVVVSILPGIKKGSIQAILNIADAVRPRLQHAITLDIADPTDPLLEKLVEGTVVDYTGTISIERDGSIGVVKDATLTLPVKKK